MIPKQYKMAHEKGINAFSGENLETLFPKINRELEMDKTIIEHFNLSARKVLSSYHCFSREDVRVFAMLTRKC